MKRDFYTNLPLFPDLINYPTQIRGREDEDDILQGTEFGDRISGRSGNDTIFGFGGIDILYGDSGDDIIYGGDGNDFLYGNGGNDQLFGGDGDDFLQMSSGRMLLDGGDGTDWTIFSGAEANHIITGTRDNLKVISKSDISGTQTKTLINVEHIFFLNGEAELGDVAGSAYYDPLYNDPNSTQNPDDEPEPTEDEDKDCPHGTGNYTVTGKWKYVEKPNDQCETTDSFSISHSKGNSILQVNNSGVATHNDKSLSVSNGVFLAGPDQIRLFSGSIAALPFSGGVSAVGDSQNSSKDLQMGGLDLVFLNLAVLKNSVRADVAVKLPKALSGSADQIEISAAYVKGFTVIVDNQGAYIGDNRLAYFALPDTEFELFGLIKVKTSHQSLSYSAITDTFKMQGKFEIESIFKGVGLDKLELDLSGDQNFIQITEGKVDIAGSLKFSKDIEWAEKGFGLSHLQLDINTLSHTFGGSVGVRLPFQTQSIELSASIQFINNPDLEVNALGIKVDELNMAVGTTGLFLKSLNASISDWSTKDKKPTVLSGGAEFTAGPEFNGAAIANFQLQIKADGNQLIGIGKVQIIDSRLFTGNITATANWEKTAYLEMKGDFNLLDGLSTFNTVIKANSKFDFAFDAKAEVAIPKFIFGIGGQKISSANIRISFSNDNNFSNDFFATWEEKSIGGLFGDAKYTIGMKYSFDGKYSVFGIENIPQIQAESQAKPNLKLAKFVEAGAEPDWIFLMVNWENTNSGANPVKIIDPNGNVINEADFASHNIQIMADLTNSNNKTVIVGNPTAGEWRIELLNETSLGDIKYSMAVENSKPELTLTSPNTTLDAPDQVEIKFNAIDRDSTANLSFYYDTDANGFDGILFKDGIVENDGTGSFVWDLDGIATGNYYVYGVLSDGINPIVQTYATGRIEVNTGGAGITEGSNASNHLVGTNQDDIIHGLGGFDIIEGLAGNDTLKGGTADDKIIDALGQNKLEGNQGNDQLITFSGSNLLIGGDDSDFLIGGFETDNLQGNAGNDLIRGDASALIGSSDHISGGQGNDILMGGRGADTFSFTTNDGQDIIGQFKTNKVNIDVETGYSVAVDKADFVSGVDMVELINFSNVNSSNVLDFISDDQGNAVFNAEGTNITFYDVQLNQLSVDDFVFI